MMQCRNIKTSEVVDVLSFEGAGMCKRTIGTTFVVYYRKGYSYPFVMNDFEFMKQFKELE